MKIMKILVFADSCSNMDFSTITISDKMFHAVSKICDTYPLVTFRETKTNSNNIFSYLWVKLPLTWKWCLWFISLLVEDSCCSSQNICIASLRQEKMDLFKTSGRTLEETIINRRLVGSCEFLYIVGSCNKQWCSTDVYKRQVLMWPIAQWPIFSLIKINEKAYDAYFQK